MQENEAIKMLIEKFNEVGRLPKKSDFEAVEVSRIKAKLGAWPRALEKAGLKPESEHYLEKRKKIENKRQKNIE